MIWRRKISEQFVERWQKLYLSFDGLQTLTIAIVIFIGALCLGFALLFLAALFFS
ncbi:MAG: hypothetical protein M1337_00885 [Actinobacteria bacterium]|nr:hypothetical protein [Actinomycetota bacterium]